MRCTRCNREFRQGEPHFCAPADRDVLYKTSAVFITMADSDRVYRSIEEAPEELRPQMEKAAMACDSVSIVIADRAGRDKIEDALNLTEHEAEPETPPPGAPAIRTVLKIAAVAAVLALAAIVLLWVLAR